MADWDQYDEIYENGWRTGYDDCVHKIQSQFSRVDGPVPAVVMRHPNGGFVTVNMEDLDYARGYLDGYARAESDYH